MRIYVDGVFDLFHYGHLQFLIKCKELYPETFLIVGVVGDNVAENYKRKPIINQKHRCDIIKSLKCTDLVIEDPPLIITKHFMDKYNIDMVIHSFSSTSDSAKQYDFFKYPISINKFQEIDYCSEISTSYIISMIKKEY